MQKPSIDNLSTRVSTNNISNGMLDAIESYYFKTFFNNGVNSGSYSKNHSRFMLNKLRMLNKETHKEQYRDIVLVLLVYSMDIFALTNRETHEILASEYTTGRTSNVFLRLLTDDERKILSEAILYHRSKDEASAVNNNLHFMLDLVNKGEPNIKNQISRCIAHTISNCELSNGYTNKIIALVNTHMKEKYGTGGYLYSSDTYMEYYGDIVTSFQLIVDKLEYEDILHYVLEHIKYNKVDIRKKFSIQTHSLRYKISNRCCFIDKVKKFLLKKVY